MGKDDKIYLGIDLGGTNIQAGVLRDGKLAAREKTKTKAELGPDGVLERIAKVVDKACDSAKIKRDELAGVGIGAPGAIDVPKGVVIEAVNLRWTDYPLAKKLEKELGVPVALDNDVNVGIWGEHKAGAAKKMTDVLGVFVGTGIGGGLVLGGELYHGYHMTAGEIGHTVIDADAKVGRRTLEQLASRTAVVNLLSALIQANYPSKLVDLTEGDLTKIRSKVLSQAYEENGPLTVEVIRMSAQYVGAAIANTMTMLSLQGAVLGGGLVEAIGQPFVDEAVEAYKQHVFPAKLRDCPILLSELGDDAGVMGAAQLAISRLGG